MNVVIRQTLCVVALVLIVGVIPASAEPYPLRTWTSSGGVSIEAQYVRRSGASVVLFSAAGKQTMIRVAALSTEDQE